MSVDVSKHLDRAKRHLEKNKLEDAAEAYESVLSEMPGHPEALQALGDLYMRLSQTDRAIKYNNMLFDHFFETHEENKALAVFTRAPKGIQQPPERLARYALLLQKQNRPNEAIEQYSFASELFLAHRNEEAALDCLERVAQLDPDNSARQIAIAELAERLGKSAIAGRGLLRAGQLAEASGDQEAGLNMMMRAHKLAPKERGPALLCAQALLRRKDAAAAMRMLEPFARGEKDPAFLRTLGEALTFTGALDRARDILERIAAGDMQHASETFEMLVDIDPYDARNQKRLSQIQAHADPAFLARMRSRLGQTATQAAETPPEGGSLPAPEEQAAPPTLEDLMVQAEIFLQYSLQSKAVDRLQKITEFFPGEEKQNQRLRNLYQLANWWPEGAAEPQAPSAERAAKPAPSAADSDTMRDLAKISEIGRSLFRLPTARAILSSGINEIGTHLRVTRCIAVIGPTGKPPELASEFCASNVEPASGAMLVRLFSQLDRAAPDALGGLPLDAAAAPVLRELGLQTVLGVALMDRERQRQA